MLLHTALLLLAPIPGPIAPQENAGEAQVAPTKAQDLDVPEAIQTGVAILLRSQEAYKTDRGVGRVPDEELEKWQAGERERLKKIRERKSKRPAAEWPYEGVYRVGPVGAIPSGYRVGGSAIVCEALLAAPGYDKDDDRKTAITQSVEFMLERIANDPTLVGQAQGDYDVRCWAHAYALGLFLHLQEPGLVAPELAGRCKAAIPGLIQALAAGEVKGGGWNYAGGATSPFMTGPTLLFLYRAHAMGFPLPDGMVDRALEGLERARNESGAYAYSGKRKEPMAASAGRAAVAELALFQAGRSDVPRLRTAVMGFFDNWEHLFDRKSKQGTHEGPYHIAPYYFFFAHTYAALAIEALPEAERPDLRARLRGLLARTQEADGGWNDRIFPRSESYSTAMCILALQAPNLAAQATWQPKEGAGEPGNTDPDAIGGGPGAPK
ncbi:MAG: hypothetical protein R3F33_01870 [Planctomycetota bacterium]